MERSKQRTLGMEERKPRARVGGLVVAPCQRGEGTYGTGVAARLAGAAGQQWRREVVGTRGGVGTMNAREAVATTDVGRGGGPSGVGAGGEESVKNARKKMAVVYICHAPLLPVSSPHRE